jgi:hypothetical protein
MSDEELAAELNSKENRKARKEMKAKLKLEAIAHRDK